MKTKFKFCVMFVLLLVALSTQLALAQDDTVVITWWNIQTQEDRQAIWEQAAAEFEAMHPNVRIEITVLENEAFKSQIVTVMQAGDPPDLFQTWGGGPLWAFADAGLVRDISDFMDADDGAWRNSFASPGVLGLFGRGDEQYGAPFNFGPVGIWYNKALMEQAGLDPDAPFTTWSEFIAAIEALKAAGITPIALGESEKWPGHFWFAYLALREGGGQAFEAAYNRTGAFTDPPFVAAYQHIVELVEMDAFQEGFLGMGYGDAAALMGRGEAAMHLMGTWEFGFQPVACDCPGLGDDLGWITFPVIEGGAGHPAEIFGGGDGFAVGANAEDEAVEFLKYLTSEEVQTRLGQSWTVPTIVGAEEILADHPFGATWIEAMAAAPTTVSFLDQFYPPGLGEAVNDTVETVFAGAATPEEAAQALEEAAVFELSF